TSVRRSGSATMNYVESGRLPIRDWYRVQIFTFRACRFYNPPMEMFSAAVRLLLRSAGQLWKLDRTTIPTIVIPTIALALAIFLSVSKRGNQRIGAVAVTEVKKWLNGVAWITAIAASLYWIVVFGWTVAKTVYTENRDLNHRAEIATIQWK